MSEVKLLPLPEGEAIGWSQAWSHDQMHDYARANMEPLIAENERLRGEVARLRRSLNEAVVHGNRQSGKAERLAEALRWIASDDTANGCDDGMQEVEAIKQRAHAALDQEGGKGGAGK